MGRSPRWTTARPTESRACAPTTRRRTRSTAPTPTSSTGGWSTRARPTTRTSSGWSRRRAGRSPGIVLTHDHPDHAEGAPLLAERAGVAVDAPARRRARRPVRRDGDAGPRRRSRRARVAPGAFAGDTVLGAGSVFVAPGGGAMAAYLDSLRRLRELDLEVIAPGHGPFVWDPRAKIDEYIEHRLDRERRVLDAIACGCAHARRAARRRVGRRAVRPTCRYCGSRRA